MNPPANSALRPVTFTKKKAWMAYQSYQTYHTLDHLMSSHWTSDEFTRSQLACFLNQLTYTANKRHMGLSNGCSSQQTTQVTNILSSTPTVPGMVCLSNEFSHPKWWSKRNTRRHLGKWRMWNWWWYRVLYIYINITHKMFSYIYIYIHIDYWSACVFTGI